MVEEYKRFRDAAEILSELEEKGQRTYTRLAPGKDIPLPPGLEGPGAGGDRGVRRAGGVIRSRTPCRTFAAGR